MGISTKPISSLEKSITLKRTDDGPILDQLRSFFINEEYLVEEYIPRSYLRLKKKTFGRRLMYQVELRVHHEDETSHLMVKVSSNRRPLFNLREKEYYYTINLMGKHLHRLNLITKDQLDNLSGHQNEQ